jgi:hypothetical protein
VELSPDVCTNVFYSRRLRNSADERCIGTVYNFTHFCVLATNVLVEAGAAAAISIYDIIPRRAYVSLHALNGRV